MNAIRSTVCALALSCQCAHAQPWIAMDYGPFLSAAIEVTPDNIACKGIAIPIAGDRSMLFDTDTLRMACGWRGGFLDLRGIVYEGTHGAWPRIDGEAEWAVPDGPGVSIDRRFREPREPAYGALPEWLGRWERLELTDSGPRLHYRIDQTNIAELPGAIEHDGLFGYARHMTFSGGDLPCYLRLVEFAHDRDESLEEGRLLVLRRGREALAIGVTGPDAGSLRLELIGRNVVCTLSPSAEPRHASIVIAPLTANDSVEAARALVRAAQTPTNVSSQGRSPLWPERLELRGGIGLSGSDESGWRRFVRARDAEPEMIELHEGAGDSSTIMSLGGGASDSIESSILVVTPDRDSVPAPGPLSAWDRNDDDPEFARDSATGEANLRLDGVTTVAGVRGQAFGFEGDATAEWLDAPIEFLDHDLTIAAWIRTEDDGVIFAQTAPRGPWVPNGKVLFIRDGRLCFDVGWVGVVEGEWPIADGEWHHVAATWEHESATIRLFVDGRPDAEGVLRPRGRVEEQQVRFGFSAPNFPSNPRFNGSMDGIRVYREALDGAGVRAAANDSGVPMLTAWGVLGRATGRWVADGPTGLALDTPRSDESFTLVRWRGPGPRLHEFVALVTNPPTFPFEIDRISWPSDNPYDSWMRFGGFDFLDGGRAAAISTWNGDVWRVDGIDADLDSLTWQRIATGLSQPLGLMVRDGDEILVAGREQITRLVDLDGDREADVYENFNDHTMNSEHFHEPVSSLQTDSEGNIYYAKGARHAKRAVHPQHGTIIRVRPDGSESQILASGLRAPNGVLVDDDGTIWCSDQQGHWMPANRINRIEPGGFYGNNWSGTGTPRDDYDPPLCWLHPTIDRSPSAQVRVPDGVWGDLSGALLGMSYGTGQVYRLLEDEVDGVHQGGMVPLPIELPTGLMRGRFHPTDGALYLCGLFGWSSNKTEPGGFYRVRRPDTPYLMPLHVRAVRDGLVMRFSDPLSPDTAAEAFEIEAWNYRWTEQYGSPDLDLDTGEIGRTDLDIRETHLSVDRRTVWLEIPDMRPAHQVHVEYNLTAESGTSADSFAHLTVHRLADESGRTLVD